MVPAGAWDVVVTCFFIDTAHNIVEYIEIISRILKDGGVGSYFVWISYFFPFFFFLSFHVSQYFRGVLDKFFVDRFG